MSSWANTEMGDQFAGIQSWYLTKPTQSGHPSMVKHNEYWWWLWSAL